MTRPPLQVQTTGLHWWVQVGGDLSAKASTDATSYQAPSVTAVVASAPDLMRTSGGSTVLIKGATFGNFGGRLSPFTVVGLGKVTYSQDIASLKQLQATGCTTSASGHDEISCRGTVSTGHALQFQVMVGGQSSEIFPSSVSYGPPEALSIRCFAFSLTPTSCDQLQSIGGDLVEISGANSSRAKGSSTVGAEYGPGGRGFVVPPGAGGGDNGCSVTTDHAMMRCKMGSGAGANHQWRAYALTGSEKQWSAVGTLRDGRTVRKGGQSVRPQRVE